MENLQLRSILIVFLCVIAVEGALASQQPVRALTTCGDVYVVDDSAKQMYAPASIELDFQFTQTRGGDAVPLRSKALAFSMGTTSMVFSTDAGNDTWRVYFSLTYDSPIQQNITLTVQDGSRQPEVSHYCMYGQNAYFYWPSIQVSTEPHPATPAETWNYGLNVLTGITNQILTSQDTIKASLFWVLVIPEVTQVVGFIIMLILLWSIKKRFS